MKSSKIILSTIKSTNKRELLFRNYLIKKPNSTQINMLNYFKEEKGESFCSNYHINRKSIDSYFHKKVCKIPSNYLYLLANEESTSNKTFFCFDMKDLKVQTMFIETCNLLKNYVPNKPLKGKKILIFSCTENKEKIILKKLLELNNEISLGIHSTLYGISAFQLRFNTKEDLNAFSNLLENKIQKKNYFQKPFFQILTDCDINYAKK